MGEYKVYEGDRTCSLQVNSLDDLILSSALPAGSAWSGVQNNATNEYYLSLADGS